MGDYTLADIRAATESEREDGFGGGWMWIIVLFLFMFGGFGGNGWGGRGNGLTQVEMQQGFDTAEITRKLDGLANGLCDGFYAQNTTMLNGFNGIQRDLCSGFSGIQRDMCGGFNAVSAQIAENRFAAQQCCCETNRNIDAVRYEAQRNTCDITTAIHAEAEATRALLKEQENQRLRDELAQARDVISNTNQSRYILGQLGRFRAYPPYGEDDSWSCGRCCA